MTMRAVRQLRRTAVRLWASQGRPTDAFEARWAELEAALSIERGVPIRDLGGLPDDTPLGVLSRPHFEEIKRMERVALFCLLDL